VFDWEGIAGVSAQSLRSRAGYITFIAFSPLVVAGGPPLASN
jgi:hypothetical protein